MLVSSVVFAVGLVVTSVAPSLSMFLVGRVLTGIGTYLNKQPETGSVCVIGVNRVLLITGAAGNFPVAISVLINITSVKRRGLFMGGLNTCFTVGVAFGALIAGALEPAIGWVCFCFTLFRRCK